MATGKGLAVQGGGGVSRTGGETYTHGAFQASYNVIVDCLGALPVALDGVLGDLRAVDVGRSQGQGMVDYADRARAWAKTVAETLTVVDRLAVPLVERVTAAGGPQEINGLRYYEEI
jgi:hypothetical protein